MKNNIKVTNTTGFTKSFSIKKLRNTPVRAKATADEIDSIVETLLQKLHQGISTQKIYYDIDRTEKENKR